MANYNTGYNTYVIGTSNSAASSLEVVLYNSLDHPELPKISLYNMSQIYSGLIEDSSHQGKFLRLGRENTSDPFIYQRGENNPLVENGFNVILYISTVDSNPIGYTEFMNQQGTINDLNIYTKFDSSIDDFIVLELNNSLGQLRNNPTVEKEFSDPEIVYMYTPAETIKRDIEVSPKYPRFTSHVYHILDNKEMILKTDSGFINSEVGAGKLSLNTNININPYGHNYTSHQVGFYGSDIVLYSWGGDRYSIQSLLQRTRFGNPIIYTSGEGGIDYKILPGLGTSRIILYFSGRFLVTMTTDYPSILEVYDIEREIWLSPKYQNFFIDTLDPRNIIRSTPNNVSSGNIVMYIPEANSVFLDLYDFSAYAGICIVKKIGDWFVFKNRISSLQDFHTYSCIDKTVHTVKLRENPIAINNTTLLIRTVDEENDLDYYTIYDVPGIEYYTERARAARHNTTPKYSKELGIMFYEGEDEETEIYRRYYKQGIIKIVHSKNGVIGNYLEGFRRSYYNNSLSEPLNVVAGFYGLIYCLDSNGNLFYL